MNRSTTTRSEDPDYCLLCNGELVVLGSRGEYSYSRCCFCGAVQIVPRISEEALLLLYQKDYSSAGHYPIDASCQAMQRRPVIEDVTRLIQSLLPDPEAPVLEIGCWWGGLLSFLLQAGIKATGLEPSEQMSDWCRCQNLPVREATLQDLRSEAESYSVIVSMAVFEHLASPRQELALYRELLRPEGRIVIQCPTAGYARLTGRMLGVLHGRAACPVELPSVFGLLEPPWHVCLPTPRGIEAAAGDAGLVLERVMPSRSGREPSLAGFLQRINENVARSGTRKRLSTRHGTCIRTEEGLRLSIQLPYLHLSG